jgi:hypothetical protein
MIALLEQHPPQLVQLVEVPKRCVLFAINNMLGGSELLRNEGAERDEGAKFESQNAWRERTSMKMVQGQYILRNSAAFQGLPAAVASASFSSFFAASLVFAEAGGVAAPVTNSSSPRRGRMKARTARFDSNRRAMTHLR